MDRSWINARRTSVEYENGVEEFLKFASSHAANNGNDNFFCPCVKCLNDKLLTIDEIREHVICDGFNKKYTRWIWHGEFEMSDISRNEEARNEEGDEESNDEEMPDNLEEMIKDVGAEAFEQSHINKSYNNLSVDADKSLYTFVMASQVKQVFYITDPSNKTVSVVLHGKRIISSDENDESSLDVSELSSFSSGLPNINSEVVVDDVHAVRLDHSEGIWENVATV
ncbi:hypothetical protein CASFOL_007606 [Castilleja foliolosa]|uniref:Transposase-associated domain-containing protein n=2 Tax=Castilleja foliolosa TaxID=1961234 RepID=A0ABD3E2F0_9LAMI